jgi:hypothetical protein
LSFSLKEDFYLRPFNHSIDINGVTTHKNADILKLDKNNNFIIENSIEIKKNKKDLVSEAMAKY